MSEDHMIKQPIEPKKYYKYYYTSMAEAMRKKHKRNGRRVCVKVGLARADTNKKWFIWYNREKDPGIIPTNNARYYDR